MRVRQSRWREAKGYPIGQHRNRELGSRLAWPEAENQLWNFITPGIQKLACDEFVANKARPGRAKGVCGHPRFFEDLLSSQPLAFNLFGELAKDLERATQAARRLWPGRVDRITRVEFEWSPGRGDAAYLGNGSAADVALFHTTPEGGNGTIFVETKYHENLRRKASPHKPRYLDVAQSSGVFQECSLPTLTRGVLQQLWLDHLLALSTRATDKLDSALFVVMYPQINQPCATAVARYRETMTPEGTATFEARTLEDVVEAMGEVVGDVWKREFVTRYLTPSVRSDASGGRR